MREKYRKKATELYRQVVEFEDHCLSTEEHEESPFLRVPEKDSFNTLIENYAEMLLDPQILQYKIGDDFVRTSSNGSLWLPPRTLYPKVRMLKKYLESRYTVPSYPQIEVIRDKELRLRITNLFISDQPNDTILREATTVLEDRLRRLSGRSGSPEEALNPGDAGSTWLGCDPETKGYLYYLAKALFKKPRNDTHHSLSESIARTEVFPTVFLIDEILSYVGHPKL